jgi:adenylate cyclase
MLATVLLGFAVLALLLLVGPSYSFVTGGVIAAAAAFGSWVAFAKAGILIDPIYPSLGALLVHLCVTAVLHVSTDRERRFVRRAFGQYLAPQLLAELEKAPHRMQLGGELREITILFMDVRAFTPISESLSATDLVHFLNTLLSPLSDAIQAEGGTIDKYIGDSIMAFWNAPLDVADHPRRACRAALAMRGLVERLNVEDAFGFKAAGLSDLQVRIGIGINTGEACVGNMGSEQRFNYSAVGDTVNIAARIESSSKNLGCDLLVSEETASRVPDFAFLEVGAVQLKGKAAPTKLLALVGDETVAAGAAFQEITNLHRQMMEALDAGQGRKAAAYAEICRRAAGPQLALLYDHFKAVAEELMAPEGRTETVAAAS